jgi:hypothetical protein
MALCSRNSTTLIIMEIWPSKMVCWKLVTAVSVVAKSRHLFVVLMAPVARSARSEADPSTRMGFGMERNVT